LVYVFLRKQKLQRDFKALLGFEEISFDQKTFEFSPFKKTLRNQNIHSCLNGYCHNNTK